MKNFILIALLIVFVAGCSGVTTSETSSSPQQSITTETVSVVQEDGNDDEADKTALPTRSSTAQPASPQVKADEMTSTKVETVIGKPNYVTGVLDYNAAQYAQALASKQDIVLDFHADWCHVCRDNEPIIRNAVSALNKPDLVVFIVDYDNAKDLRREFNVVTQTTLIMIPSGDTSKQTRFIGPLSLEKATELFTF